LLPVAFLQFQRRFESEADLLAVNVTARAGYDPEGLANYIERVQTDPSPPALSPVPTRDQSVEAIRQAITASQMTYTASGDFVLIQQEIRRLPPAPPPAPKLNK
jgi:predicted Zn-dependent protease